MSVKPLMFVAACCLSSQVSAHSLFLNCEQQDENIACTGGFSDGTKANNLPVEVFSYDDELLAQGKTDDNSHYQFTRPDSDFYILMDAGPGHVVEVDVADI